MSPRKRYTFWIDEGQSEALSIVRQRDGILPSEQIRRALDEWFARRGLKAKSAPRRAQTRRKA